MNLVLQQCSFDEYRAIQSVQDKARVAGNGHSLAKTLNAVLDALGCSLRAIQETVIHVVASFVKGTTIPFKTRLVANGFLNRCIHQNYVAGVLVKQIFLFGFVFFLFNLTAITIPQAHAADGDKAVGNVNDTVVQQIGVKSPATDLWREVRQGTKDGSGNLIGLSQVKGPNASTLINVGGQEWRNWRTTKLIPYSMYAIGGMLLLIVLYRLIRGKIKIAAGLSGKKIKRFTDLQRFVHWSVAILFVIMGITGLILTLGRYGLLPIIGKEAFGFIAHYGKLIHNYLGPVFSVMLIVMLFTFFKGNLFNQTDFKWLLKGGGLFGGHISAGRYNGGEKAWYWIAAIVGLVVIGSGLLLNFPILITMLGISQEQHEYAQFLHAVGSIGIFVVSFGHIYMGTIAMEGAFEVMKTGKCDTNWAKEHHDLWYAELQANGSLTLQQDSKNKASNDSAQIA